MNKLIRLSENVSCQHLC